MKRGPMMKQRPCLGCYVSLHKYEYQVNVHLRNSRPREDSVTENEEYSRRQRQCQKCGPWAGGQRRVGNSRFDSQLKNLHHYQHVAGTRVGFNAFSVCMKDSESLDG